MENGGVLGVQTLMLSLKALPLNGTLLERTATGNRRVERKQGRGWHQHFRGFRARINGEIFRFYQHPWCKLISTILENPVSVGLEGRKDGQIKEL